MTVVNSGRARPCVNGLVRPDGKGPPDTCPRSGSRYENAPRPRAVPCPAHAVADGRRPAQPARSPMTVSPAMLARVDQESEAVLLRLYRLSPGARRAGPRLRHADRARPAGGWRHPGSGLWARRADRGGRRTHLLQRYRRSARGHTRPGRQVPRPVLFDTGRAADVPGRAGLGGGRERRHPDPGRAGPDGAARSGARPIAGFILADDHLARGLSLSGSLFIKVPMFLCSDASAACAADGAMPQGR